MRRVQILVAAALFAVPVTLLASCSGGHGSGFQEEQAAADQSADAIALSRIETHGHTDLCDAASIRAGGGAARCHAKVRTDPSGGIQIFASPSGLGPSDLRSAYALPTSGGGGKTVAIVDAYDAPNAEKDMGTYRAQFGLPACTTANGCFKKVNQSGQQGSYPTADSGWAGEIALDLDMVSAVCPDCKILLVEASSASMSDLGTSVNTAVSLGAVAVSNSYGGGEDSSDSSVSSQYFNHPGVFITVSSGDGGYGVEFPASSQYVIAVGGTSLTKSSSSRGWAEGVWNGAGSGCSGQIAKPSWQKDTGCAKRTVADVSAVADPNTGVAVYNGGWAVYGGTSASSPIVAAAFTLVGKSNVTGQYLYANPGAFYDVTTGNNGSCSSGSKYLCTAGAGYDGPTGLGTPNGAVLGSGGGGGGTDAGAKDSGGGGTPDSGGGGTPDSGGGGGACAHPICASGSKLTSSCDPCATKVCARDSYCCNTLWDNQCVGEVASICGQSCGGGGGCAHPICATGGKLTSSCDACATKICAQDSYCCNNQWDSTCVGEVKSICGQTCP